MKKPKQILAAVILSLAFGTTAGAPKWEYMGPATQACENIASGKIEMNVSAGYIYLSSQRPVSVKLLSILGQLVTQQNLPAGVSRIKVAAPGIYILKAGGVTKRVTIK